MMKISLFSLILFTGGVVHAQLQCPPAKVDHSKVERLNERYDDFFRYQRAKEEHEAKLERGVPEVKAMREIHEKELERAREAYVAKPKDPEREERLRLEWEKRQKLREAEHVEARRCELLSRHEAESAEKRGRKIPEMKEYDLDE